MPINMYTLPIPDLIIWILYIALSIDFPSEYCSNKSFYPPEGGSSSGHFIYQRILWVRSSNMVWLDMS